MLHSSTEDANHNASICYSRTLRPLHLTGARLPYTPVSTVSAASNRLAVSEAWRRLGGVSRLVAHRLCLSHATARFL